MRTGSLRGAPLAGLVSAYHAVHVGPCSVIRVASAWRKKLPTRKCGSAYPNCAICSPRCYGAGGTALNTCCIGPSGEDDISFAPCAATIESADRLCRSSIYNCSTRSVCAVRVEKIRSEPNKVALGFRILERGDGAKIQLIYAGDPLGKIVLEGSVVGATIPAERNIANPTKYAME